MKNEKLYYSILHFVIEIFTATSVILLMMIITLYWIIVFHIFLG